MCFTELEINCICHILLSWVRGCGIFPLRTIYKCFSILDAWILFNDGQGVCIGKVHPNYIIQLNIT